jgi:carbon-monoxide dehydrogenase medium subunit
MFPAKFAYAAPSSLQEAVGLLEDPDAKVLAGGHSLLPLMKLRLAQPKLLVDIGRIPGLSYIRTEDGHLAIGAMTTYRPDGPRQRHVGGRTGPRRSSR